MTTKESSNDYENRLNYRVFYGSVMGMSTFLLLTMIYTEQAGAVFSAGLTWISETFGWYYMLAAVAYFVFVIAIACSRFGKIRLGPDNSRPEFSLLSWSSMLFAAGIGIDVLFFSVAEPLSHYLAPPDLTPASAAALRNSVPQTFFHWGLSGWAMYALMGIALAYFSYRHRLPLAIRSTLFPLIGKRFDGPIGNAVDIIAVISTIFGIATSLGIGVMQLNYGLTFMFGVSESLSIQILLIVLVVAIATVSAITGVDKGIRRLSEFNMLLATALLLFILFQGETLWLLDALVLNVGDYLGGFIGRSFDTYAYASEDAQQWKGWWTIFFWAWWIAWTPLIGMFLARISRGRTIREFIVGALLIPMGFMMAWMSILGNTGIELVSENGLAELGEQALNSPQATIYTLLEQYPYVSISASAVVLLAVLFFVTSADSCALVVANLTSKLADVNHDAPPFLRFFWAAVIGAITIALLMAGGLDALQSVVVISALPFSIVLFLIMAGLYRALHQESERYKARRMASTHTSSGDWREALDRTLDPSNPDGATATLKHAILPALEEFAEELGKRGQVAGVDEDHIEGEPLPRLTLTVRLEGAQSFIYQVRPYQMRAPSFLPADDDYYLRLDVHLTEGGHGRNQLNGYNHYEVLSDVLYEYQRHLHYLAITGKVADSKNVQEMLDYSSSIA